jgi:hypothetical protein
MRKIKIILQHPSICCRIIFISPPRAFYTRARLLPLSSRIKDLGISRSPAQLSVAKQRRALVALEAEAQPPAHF